MMLGTAAASSISPLLTTIESSLEHLIACPCSNVPSASPSHGFMGAQDSQDALRQVIAQQHLIVVHAVRHALFCSTTAVITACS